MLGIFLDTETNGLNPFTHKTLEIAFKILELETGIEIEGYQSIISRSNQDWDGSDPQSLAVNGLSFEILNKGKPVSEVSEEIQSCFARRNIKRGSSVFICQNPSFDRPFFSQIVGVEIQERKEWPYHWLDLASMYVAAGLLKKKQTPSLPYPWEDGLSKDAIAKKSGLPKEKTPHRAMQGVDHLILCYQAVVGFPIQ